MHLNFLPTADGPMLEGSSPELLKRLLEELDDEARNAGPHVEAWAAPGVPADTARKALEAVGQKLPAEVGVWFNWHSGFRPEAPHGSPYPNLVIATLDEAVVRYRASRDFVAPTGPSAPPAEVFEFGAGQGWLRLVPSNFGLAVECSTDEAVPRIRCASEDFFFEPQAYRARSLCTFVAWRLYGIRNGAYKWDESRSSWVTDGLLLHPLQRAAIFS